MLMHECAPSVERAPCSKWLPRVEVERLDGEVARLARMVSAKRLDLGEALEALGKGGGYHELGFSSFGAYAIERCEKSGRPGAGRARLTERRTRGLWRGGWPSCRCCGRRCERDR